MKQCTFEEAFRRACALIKTNKFDYMANHFNSVRSISNHKILIEFIHKNKLGIQSRSRNSLTKFAYEMLLHLAIHCQNIQKPSYKENYNY